MIDHLIFSPRMGLIQTPDQLKFSYLSIMEVPWNFLSFSFLFHFVGSQAVGFDRFYSRLWGTCCRGMFIFPRKQNNSNIFCLKSQQQKIAWAQRSNDQASDSDSEEEVPPPLPPPRTESLKKEVTTGCNSTIIAPWRNWLDKSPTRWLWLATVQ